MAEERKGRPDTQITGMAGEFLAAGKLFKRGLQVSVTLGNAKAIDLFVHNPRTGRTFKVQVKALSRKNCFPMKRENLRPDYIYIFVLLNGPDEQEQFFVVPGRTILNDINHFFGASYTRDKPNTFPAINYSPLRKFNGNWALFER